MNLHHHKKSFGAIQNREIERSQNIFGSLFELGIDIREHLSDKAKIAIGADSIVDRIIETRAEDAGVTEENKHLLGTPSPGSVSEEAIRASETDGMHLGEVKYMSTGRPYCIE